MQFYFYTLPSCTLDHAPEFLSLMFALIFSQRLTGVHLPDISLVNLISVLFVKKHLEQWAQMSFLCWSCLLALFVLELQGIASYRTLPKSFMDARIREWEGKTPLRGRGHPRELYDLVPNDCQCIKNDYINCIKRTPHLVISLDSQQNQKRSASRFKRD